MSDMRWVCTTTQQSTERVESTAHTKVRYFVAISVFLMLCVVELLWLQLSSISPQLHCALAKPKAETKRKNTKKVPKVKTTTLSRNSIFKYTLMILIQF